MIPLRDANPRLHRPPLVNVTLIAINVVVFLWEISLGPRLEPALYQYAFIPARFWSAGGWTHDLLTMFLSMFLHGGWLHLGSNMLYLWIFGDNIEDQLGHGRYLLFYLLCGAAATMAHAVFNASSTLPSIGASGAIAGVLGAYLLLFPRARVHTLIPLGFFITMSALPAIVVLGLWFVIQFFSGIASIGVSTAQTGGVAWFAHIGGFVAGLLLIRPLAIGAKVPARVADRR
ncbi:MAG TPA: rhomboid family intramembrane serine protease [Thermoanaerobaculia bacterium]|nr:rhomboid family intramembrane serine protease [Thermoanaerobaculia bacterium]